MACRILLFNSVFTGKPRGLGNSNSERNQSCKIPRLPASGTSKPCEIVLGRYQSCGSRFVRYTMTQAQLSSNRWRLLKMESSKSLVFWEQRRTAHSTYTGAELRAVWWVPVGLGLRRSSLQIQHNVHQHHRTSGGLFHLFSQGPTPWVLSQCHRLHGLICQHEKWGLPARNGLIRCCLYIIIF